MDTRETQFENFSTVTSKKNPTPTGCHFRQRTVSGQPVNFHQTTRNLFTIPKPFNQNRCLAAVGLQPREHINRKSKKRDIDSNLHEVKKRREDRSNLKIETE